MFNPIWLIIFTDVSSLKAGLLKVWRQNFKAKMADAEEDVIACPSLVRNLRYPGDATTQTLAQAQVRGTIFFSCACVAPGLRTLVSCALLASYG